MDPSNNSTYDSFGESVAVMVAPVEEAVSDGSAVNTGTTGTNSTELYKTPPCSAEDVNSGDPPTTADQMPQQQAATTKPKSGDGTSPSAPASVKVEAKPAKTCYPIATNEAAHSLLSLPIDSLHCVASFLTPADWSSVSLSSKPAHRVCREIFRRVRMHGFLCATEVVTAWKLGQHADARELSALYIQSGVPIYPYSLGHSYQTLAWRMGIEAKEMEEASSPTSDENAEDANNTTHRNTAGPMDQFYAERFPTRGGDRFAELNGSNLSYLEEKCLFWHTREGGSDGANSRHGSQLHRPNIPKMVVKVHQHLADQHVLGRPKVDDENGAMEAAPVSLSADFFHPHLTVSTTDETYQNVATVVESNVESEGGVSPGPASEALPVPPLFSEAGSHILDGLEDEEDNDVVVAQRSFGVPDAAHMEATRLAFPPPQDENASLRTANREKSILANVQLETYSSSSASTKSEQKDATSVLRSHLRTRFSLFQRRVELLLTNFDNAGVDECLLDFWDEFLPRTKNIHFYDRHTAVPRTSGLESFLSSPCPKAIGIVQCEIERIKVSSKKKGVSMKGRLFPTYEYRLFIRDRRSSSTDNPIDDDDSEPTRRDTVLMMAKNRGKNYPGGYSMATSSKKGVNNYYLYLPQQADIDAHFNSVNNIDSSSSGAGRKKGSSKRKTDEAALLGRLQSNFTGTEFQIFTPTIVKKMVVGGSTNIDASSDGDNDLGSDSGVSSDNASSRRLGSLRHRLTSPRMLSRGNSELNEEVPQGNDEKPRRSTTPDKRRSMRRTRSLPAIPYGNRSKSRRAIANSVDTPEREEAQEVVCEEENGAITYTANLLGNRPRIMDVCIPKVTPDGTAGATWKKYLESCHDVNDSASGNRMLQHFKQLQQRQETNDANNANNPTDASEDGIADGENGDYGLLPLQNRPPWWNVELGAFVLNFGGRVSVASVKNFQLCHKNDQDYIMLQFGRTQGRHSFTMDFQHPLTAVQAFAIAISSLQSKISFG